MMAITHAAIAAAGVSIALSTGQPLDLLLAVVGSQLPDLDTSSSLIGQVCFPVSHWIEDRYPHRSVTHSLIASGVLLVLSAVASKLFLGDWWELVALPLGHMFACFSDCFTRKGVQLFWPNPAWAISVSNPRRRLVTGGPGEYWVLCGATALLLVGLWLSGTGGITKQVDQSLGLRSGAVDTYNAQAGQHQMWANIVGVFASDRSPADSRYLIVGSTGNEFIVTDGSVLYQTGKQILPTKLTVEKGVEGRLQSVNLELEDEDLTAALSRFQSKNGDAAIYLSGRLTIDLPNEVDIDQTKGLETMTVASNSVTLDYAPLYDAQRSLTGQYAIGTLQAQIITPRPSYEQK